jgi:hypothetical protein
MGLTRLADAERTEPVEDRVFGEHVQPTAPFHEFLDADN